MHENGEHQVSKTMKAELQIILGQGQIFFRVKSGPKHCENSQNRLSNPNMVMFTSHLLFSIEFSLRMPTFDYENI